VEQRENLESTPGKRLAYRTPEIQDIGSLVELTQAKPVAGSQDNSYGPGFSAS
jgi:hypothetical protein